MSSQISPFVLNNHISVQAVAEFIGHSLQYIRRLLQYGKLPGLKVGQFWLVEKSSFEAYLEKACHDIDRRFGPKQPSVIYVKPFPMDKHPRPGHQIATRNLPNSNTENLPGLADGN